MSLHIRGKHGATLLSKEDGSITAYNTKTPETLGLCVYPYWHPSGHYIAYSTNVTKQTFHSADRNRIEVFDDASDIQVYDIDKNELLLSPLLNRSISVRHRPFPKTITNSTPYATTSAVLISTQLQANSAIV